MGDRIDLPSGGWAELIDTDRLRGAFRKKVLAEAGLDVAASTEFTRGLAVTMSTGRAVIARFSLPYDPFNDGVYLAPSTDQWDEWELADQDAIYGSEAFAKVAAILYPAQPSVDNQKPGSPTPPAGG